MRGTVSEVMLAVFALMIGALILTLILPRIGGPTVEYYGNEQARMVAHFVAGSISGLDYAGGGSITHDFVAEWSILVYEEGGTTYVRASHFDDQGSGFTSTVNGNDVEVLGDTRLTKTAITARKVKVIKEPGMPAEVKKG